MNENDRRINGDPVVQVRLSEVAEPKRTEITERMLAAQAKAKALKAIRGTKGVSDANAFPSEGETLGRGAMARADKDSGKVSDADPAKSKRSLGAEFVRPDDDNLVVTDGQKGDDRVNTGQFVPGPDVETVDVGGVPTVRRRRR